MRLKGCTMAKDSLNELKKFYENGGNLINHLKNLNNSKRNSDEMIMISYDFQSGSYIKKINENPEFTEKYTNAMAKVINGLGTHESILEAGVGEATTLANVLPKLKPQPKNIYGFA